MSDELIDKTIRDHDELKDCKQYRHLSNLYINNELLQYYLYCLIKKRVIRKRFHKYEKIIL